MFPQEQEFLEGGYVASDCLRASVAIIFDEPANNIPHFLLFDDWIGALLLFIDGRKRDIRIHRENPGVVSIAVGMSPRGTRHAVVWGESGLLCDPYPGGEGLQGEPTEFWEIVEAPEGGEPT